MATKYNINSMLEKDKKDVELLDGTILDLTFTPMIVNKLYAHFIEKQSEIQKIAEEYRKNQRLTKSAAEKSQKAEDIKKEIKKGKLDEKDKELKQKKMEQLYSEAEKEHNEAQEYFDNSDETTKKRINELNEETQDNIRSIIEATVDYNNNEGVKIDEDWWNKRTKEEINMLVQIILDIVKEDDKKKSTNKKKN